MINVLDMNGNFFKSTERNGKIRRLIRDKKAKVVKREPFTVQLLYEPETNVRPTIIRSKNMNIIISNDSRFPLGLVPKDSQKISSNDFKLNVPTEYEAIYADVDSVDKKLYSILQNMDKVRYFRYNTKDYIKEPVSILDLSVIGSKENQINVKFYANQEYRATKILIAGNNYKATRSLIKNVKQQLINKDVELYSFNLLSDEEEIITKLDQIAKEVRERFAYVQINDEDSIYQTKDCDKYKSKFIILEDFSSIMQGYNYKLIESIKDNLTFILQYCDLVGIGVLIACNRASGGVISSIMKQNINTCIAIGILDDGALSLLYDRCVKLDISGKYVDYYANIGFKDDAFKNIIKFEIDEIKNLL